jgi:DNA mismatch endonuclease (patch repair protein)
LPGKPDLVFASRRKVIFIHGCFWHVHTCRAGRSTPATNSQFWQRKREANVARDSRTLRSLRSAGWQVLVVWQCELQSLGVLTSRIVAFLKA